MADPPLSVATKPTGTSSAASSSQVSGSAKNSLCQTYEIPNIVDFPADPARDAGYSRPFSTLLLTLECCLLAAFFACIGSTKRDSAFVFLVSVAVPMSLRCIAELSETLVMVSDPFPNHRTLAALEAASTVFEVIVRNTFSISLISYAVLMINLAKNRYQQSKRCRRIPFVASVFVATAVSLLSLLWPSFPALHHVFAAFSFFSWIIISIMMLIAFLSTKRKKASLPTGSAEAKDARKRLGWTLIYSLLTAPVIFLPTFAAFALSEFQIMGIGSAFQQVVILLNAFLFLPAFRSALFGCCSTSRTDQKDPQPCPTNGHVIVVAPASSEFWKRDNNNNTNDNNNNHLYTKPDVNNIRFIRIPVRLNSRGNPEILLEVPPAYGSPSAPPIEE